MVTATGELIQAAIVLGALVWGFVWVILAMRTGR